MSFPTPTLLDNFNRANESPCSNGGKWTDFKYPGKAKTATRVNNNEFGAFGEPSVAEWNVGEYLSPALSCKGTSLGTGFFFLFGCLKLSGEKVTQAYVLECKQESAGKWRFRLIKFEGEVETILATFSATAWKEGDFAGLQVNEGIISAWKKEGAGAWTQVGEAADSKYTTGFVGLGASEGRMLDEFSAVATPVSHEHTLSASQSQSATAVRNPERKLSASQGQSAAVSTGPGRKLSASQSQSAAEVEHIRGHASSHTQEAETGSSATIRHYLSGKTLSASQSSSAVIVRTPKRVLSASQTSSATATYVNTSPVTNKIRMLI